MQLLKAIKIKKFYFYAFIFIFPLVYLPLCYLSISSTEQTFLNYLALGLNSQMPGGPNRF